MTRRSMGVEENKLCCLGCEGSAEEGCIAWVSSAVSKSYAVAVAVAAIGYVSGEMRDGVARTLLPQRRQRWSSSKTQV